MPATPVGRKYKGRRTPTLFEELGTLLRFKARANKPSPIRRSMLARLSFEHVSPGIARRLHETKAIPRYVIDRDLKWYNSEFKRCRLEHTIEELINGIGRRKVRLLDIGAGFGQLKASLDEEIAKQPEGQPTTGSIRKSIEYYGIDFRENPQNRVKAMDLVSERLPENFYDVIVAVQSLPYMTDKLKAIEKLVNALRVGGVLQIAEFGEIEVNGIPIYARPEILKNLLRRPYLEVEAISWRGIRIKRIGKGRLEMEARFEKASAFGKARLQRDLVEGFPAGTEAMLLSKYSVPKKS